MDNDQLTIDNSPLVPAGYQRTEVGVIPEDWGVIKVEKTTDYITVGFVGSMAHLFVDKGIPLLRGKNILQNKLNLEDTKYISPETHHKWKKSALMPGDVVVVRVGYPGTACVIPKNLGEANAASLVLIRPNQNLVVPSFLCDVFNSPWGLTQIQAMLVGGAQQVFNTNTAANFLIPLPPLPEQRAIAAALSDVDALIAALDRLIVKKRAIKQGAMQQLLTGQTRLPGFSGPWEVKQFGDVVYLRKERIDPQTASTQDFCVELEHIEQGTGCLAGYATTEASFSQKSVFYKGDVLFGKLRAYLRKYWLAERDGVCSTEIWVFVARDTRLIPEFLFQLVRMDRFIEIASTAYGTHMPRSDWNIVKNYEIHLPSIEEQRAIAEVLSDMDAEIAALEARRDKTRALKQGMMQELLTGRIRLV